MRAPPTKATPPVTVAGVESAPALSGLIKCATLNKLIERMTTALPQEQSMTLRYTFLLTYQSFTTPREFLHRLASRYAMPLPPNATPAELDLFVQRRLAPMQIKVLAVIKNWLEEHYSDFEDDAALRLELRALIDSMIANSLGPWATNAARQLIRVLTMKESGVQRPVVEETGFPPSLVDPAMELSEFKLMDCKPLEIARQLSLVDMSLFLKVQPREMLNKAWTKPDTKHKNAPNLVAMTKRFNCVSSWVMIEVLGYKLPEHRAARIVKFIKVAKHLRFLNNFFSLYAIFSALNSGPIYRLNKTWALVPSKQTQRMDAFRALFSSDRNSTFFRRTLERTMTPCIPHLGLFLTDLFYIEENSDELCGMINFHKRRMLAERIQWIKQFQQVPYRFRPVLAVQKYIERHAAIEGEDDVWRLSMAIEPR